MYRTVTIPIIRTTIAPSKNVPDCLIFPVPLNRAVLVNISPSKITMAGNMYFFMRRLRSSIGIILITNLMFFSNFASYNANKLYSSNNSK